jgi:5-formyltetrahydrofolate cyclo-ligase
LNYFELDSKQYLRRKFKKLRDSLPIAYQRSASEKIAKKVLALPEIKRAQTIGLYLSKGSEVRTFSIVKNLLQLKKTVAVPKVYKKSMHLHFHIIRSLKDCCLGMFNILEPLSRCPRIDPKKMQVLLIPGIVFDKQGYRLGYGKGFYDRFIKKHQHDLTLGLTYRKTLIQRLPRQKTDISVHRVMTD